jgi:restriction endonuclease S subunit
MTRIKDIAQIRSGYLFRRGIEESPEGKYAIVQIKDVAGYRDLNGSQLVRTDLDNVRPDYLVRPGDVLFGSRGSRKHALAVRTVPKNAVFSYQVFAIETREQVLPEYLSWYINQPQAQRYIEENSAGSYITTISKTALADMPLTVPTIEVQRKIVEVFQLFETEKTLVQQIEEKRGHLVEATLHSAVRRQAANK